MKAGINEFTLHPFSRSKKFIILEADVSDEIDGIVCVKISLKHKNASATEFARKNIQKRFTV